jgi:hypothetical protein
VVRVSKNVEVEVEILPANLITKEELARRLRPDDPLKKGIQWIREKVRPRSPNPLPCYNLGNHLMFHWPDVCEWIRNSPRPTHTPRTHAAVWTVDRWNEGKRNDDPTPRKLMQLKLPSWALELVEGSRCQFR